MAWEAQMTAEVVALHKQSLKQVLTEVHRQFSNATEGNNKADRARIRAGVLLLQLRERIEAGEAGEGVKWWTWYRDNCVRDRKDAEKVMKLAASENPDAAAAAARLANREAVAKHRTEKGKKSPAYSKRESDDPDAASQAGNKKTTARVGRNLVDDALALVEQMTNEQRREFSVQFRRHYANS